MAAELTQWLFGDAVGHRWLTRGMLAAWALAMAPAVFLGVLGSVSLHRHLTASALNRRQALATLAAMTVEEKLDRLVDVGRSLASRARFREMIARGEWDGAAQTFEGALKDFPGLDRIFLTTLDGTLMADLPALPGVRGKNFAFRDWYHGVSREWRPYLSDVYLRTAQPQRLGVAIAIPVKTDDGSLLGILVLQVLLDEFHAWTGRIDAGPSGIIYITDRAGRLAAHPQISPEREALDFSAIPAVRRVLAGADGVETGVDPLNREAVVAAYAPVGRYGWAVVASQSAREAFRIRTDSLRGHALVYGALLVVMGLLTALVVRLIGGRFRVEEERARIFDLALDLMCVAGFDGYFKQLNPQWERVLGFTTQELCARPYVEFIHPDDRESTVAEAGRQATGKAAIRFENRYRCNDGSYRWLSWNAVPIQEEGLIYAAARDITELKEMEQERQRHAERLEYLNKELESFSYSVSHDLRAPLRAIDGFSKALVEDCGGQLDAEGHRMLGIVRANVQRMGQLIDDLLAFSRLSRQQLSAGDVDMTELVRSAFGDLRAANPQRALELKLGTLPAARGDSAMLQQMWVNLLSNAVKFTGPRAAAVIEVGGVEDGEECRYFVKDNGVGFDMRYVEKLFGIFQRLHDQAAFDGTGVGLAIVQRVVTRHGGRVWAEGAVDAGAIFHFTLPRGGRP